MSGMFYLKTRVRSSPGRGIAREANRFNNLYLFPRVGDRWVDACFGPLDENSASWSLQGKALVIGTAVEGRATRGLDLYSFGSNTSWGIVNMSPPAAEPQPFSLVPSHGAKVLVEESAEWNGWIGKLRSRRSDCAHERAVCDWWLGQPELFWDKKERSFALPSNCAGVDLVADDASKYPSRFAADSDGAPVHKFSQVRVQRE